MARMDMESGAPFPLNPRDRNIASYFLADRLWVRDLHIHLAWVNYTTDKHRPKD